jgi:hypothetical protein
MQLHTRRFPVREFDSCLFESLRPKSRATRKAAKELLMRCSCYAEDTIIRKAIIDAA